MKSPSVCGRPDVEITEKPQVPTEKKIKNEQNVGEHHSE
jgi:hypothetical protein